jgi:glycosyltransferase involved in cell wall biosynthesis
MYIAIGFFGKYFIPLIFGAKAYPILPYIQLYALAIAMYVITSTIVNYHLARHHYIFPATALLLSLGMCLGVIFFHKSVADIVMVVLIVSMISLGVMTLLHLLLKNGRFLIKNLIDLVGLFIPLPKAEVVSGSGKRILIFNWRDSKHKFAGGAEVYIHELAKRWVKSGNQVTLFCGNDGNCLRNEVIDGVQIIRRGGFYFVYIWAFLYYLLRFRGQYDVIVDSENGIPFFTPFYSGEKKFLLIHHVHQEVFRKSLVPPLSWIATFLEIYLMPSVYKNIQTITVSPSSKKEILDKELTDIEPVIIYNGVDLAKYKPAEKSSVPLVLYLGRLKYYKSLHIFIHAVKKILEQIPKARFVIAGDGEEKEGLIKLAKKIGVFSKIEFRGKVSEEDKIRLYQKAWVFVNPSFMEGWGITTIEANACGTPVVASNVPGLRDSVDNPHSGFLVPYGSINIFSERIIKLIKDDSLRAKMSIEAMYWVQQFDWQKSAEKSLQLINQ